MIKVMVGGSPGQEITAQQIVDRLNQDMGPEGYRFKLFPETEIEGGFGRMMMTRGGDYGEWDAFIDIRGGQMSPGGPTIEMASSKPNTYGIPGFTSVEGEQIKSPMANFQSLIKSVYQRSEVEGKPVQSLIWSTYQEGYQPQRLPAAGTVLTPSSSLEQRRWEAKTVRFFTPRGTESQEIDQYLQNLQQSIDRGRVPELLGYAPSTKDWSVLSPAVPVVFSGQHNLAEFETYQGVTVRSPGQMTKSVPTVWGAQHLADVALTQSGATITPSKPTRGWGIRRGWTQAGGIGGRNVFSKMVGFADTADMPGAALEAPSFRDVEVEGKKTKVYSFGERMNIQAPMSVSGMTELAELLESGKIRFEDLQSKTQRSGKGGFMVGSIQHGTPITQGEIYDQLMSMRKPRAHSPYINWAGKTYLGEEVGGQVQFTERIPIIGERRGYNVVSQRPTLQIPAYYNPISQAREFSNVEQIGYQSTAPIVAALQKAFGDRMDVRGYSSRGSGLSESAEAYVNVPVVSVLQTSLKAGAGVKAYNYPIGSPLLAKILGRQEPVSLDVMTQEGKAPPLALKAAFDVMNLRTQLSFLKEFLPHETEADKIQLAAAQKYLKETFPKYDLEKMASLYYDPEQRGTGPAATSDTMFAKIGLKILDTTKGKDLHRYWKRFGIGVFSEQSMGTTTYSVSGKAEMERLIGEYPELADLLEFEEFTGPAKAGIEPRKQYRLKQKVAKRGGLIMTAGLSNVPEYPSPGGLLNPQAIASLVENYHEASRELGGRLPLVSTEGGEEHFRGAMAGIDDAAQKGWEDLVFWRALQSDLNAGRASIPRFAIPLNEKVAAYLQTVLDKANQFGSTEERLNAMERGLSPSKETLVTLGLDQDTNLKEAFFLDKNTISLVPKFSSIKAVESYEKSGVFGEQQTVNFWGDQYMRYLAGTLSSYASDPVYAFESIQKAKNAFYNRIESNMNPVDAAGRPGKSKAILENLTGIRLPGTRFGRYQGMTNLEQGEGYASDEWIRKFLSTKKYSAQQIKDLMGWLNSGEDAYLPALFERYPDVSATYNWMPVKIRSAQWLQDRGVVTPPNKPGHEGMLFLNPITNRFQIGDFDADPAQSLLLPIDRMESGAWRMPDAIQKEFDTNFNYLYDVNAKAVDKALQGIAGDRYSLWNKGTLDVQRKNLMEYRDAVISKPTVRSRLEATSLNALSDISAAAMKVRHFKHGMGVSYLRRTMTEDVMDAVLSHSEQRDEAIRRASYERSGLTYQLYLDQQNAVAKDFSVLEKLFNSIGINNFTTEGGLSYSVGFYQSKQDWSDEQYQSWRSAQDTEVERKRREGDPDAKVREPYAKNLFWATAQQPGRFIRAIINELAGMDRDKLSDAMLAYGLANTGRANEAYEALTNPSEFFRGQATQPKELGNILTKLFEQGVVGFHSPYVATALYRSTERFARKHPGDVTNPGVKLPWINGEVLPIKDIMETQEYRAMNVLDRLFVKRQAAVGAWEIDSLANAMSGRLGGIFKGIRQDFVQSVGGLIPSEQAVEEFGINFARQKELGMRLLLGDSPIVHASEVGGIFTAGPGMEKGFAPIAQTPERTQQIAVANAYKAILKWMGATSILGDRDNPMGSVFIPVTYEHVPELYEAEKERKVPVSQAIPWGNRFEAAFALQRKATLHHVGKVERSEQPADLVNPKNLTFSLRGVRFTGVPDFVDFDEQSGSMVIVDTKLALNDPEDPARGVGSRRRVMNYKHYLQQVTYAYGLEQLAKTGTEQEWLDKMHGWKFEAKDDPKLRRMRAAAASGNIKLFLQPGFEEGGVLTTYNPISIPYGPEQKAELEMVADYMRSKVFNQWAVTDVASKINQALKTPGEVPPELAGLYARTSRGAQPADYIVLSQLAGERKSGGGETSQRGSRTIRVGEAGPEDIILKGDADIVPTNQLPEKRRQRGEGQGMAGKTDVRFTGGLQGASWGPPGGPGPAGMPAQQPQPTTEQMDARIEQYMTAMKAEWTDTLRELTSIISPTGDVSVHMQFGGAKAPPKDLTNTVSTENSLAAWTEFRRYQPELEQNLRASLIGSIRRAGQGDILPQHPEAAKSIELLNLAIENLAPEQYLPAMTPHMKRLQQVARATPVLQKGWSLMQKMEAELGQPTDYGMALPSRVTSHPLYQEMSQALGIDTGNEYPMTFENVSATASTAAVMAAAKKNFPELLRPNKWEGVSTEAIQKLSKSMEDLDKATIRVTETHKGLADLEHKELQVKAAEARVGYEQLQYRAGPLFEGGKFVGETRMSEMVEQGVATSEQAEYARKAIQGRAKVQETEEEAAQSPFERRAGNVARRLFGGWGLMYIRSIGNLALAPTKIGYGEMLTEQTQAAAAMGQVYGGMQMPVNPELQYQHAMALMGGSGYAALRTAQTNLIRQQPGLYQAGQAALGGLASGGMAAWILGMAGLPLMPVAPLVGAAAAVGAVGLNAYGAYTEIDKTAVSAAARLGMGQQLGFQTPTPIPGQVRPAGINGPSILDSISWAYGMNPEIKARADLLQKMRQSGSPQSFVAGMSQSQQAEIMAQYAQVTGQLLPNIPIEGVLQAEATRARYNMPRVNIESLATAINQNVPVIPTAQAIAAVGTTNFAQRESATGNLINILLGKPQAYIEQMQFGVQRMGQLGLWGQMPGANAWQIQGRVEQLSNMENMGFDLYQRQTQIAAQRAMQGGAYAAPMISSYAGAYTPQSYAQEMMKIQQQTQILNAQGNLQSNWLQAGVGFAQSYPLVQNLTMGQMGQMGTQLNFGQNLQGQMMGGGISAVNAQGFAGAFGLMNPKQFAMYSGMAQFQPLQTAAWALQNPVAARAYSMNLLPGIAGTQINPLFTAMTDIGTGGLTGMQWGTTSLANPMQVAGLMASPNIMGGQFAPTGGMSMAQAVQTSSAAMAQNIWGNWQQRGNVSQGLIGAMIQGGTMGGQFWQMQQNAQYQAAQAGNQLAQLELQAKYQPLFWNIEDRQRALQNRQQMWQFGQQREQLEMSNQFFYQNLGLQREQTQMQRGWTQEDWTYQGRTRAMQWAWRQEDFQEQARFLTGRERGMAEKQMRRETILYGLEGEQIDKQKTRQQEVWRLEDERYQLEISQHEAQKDFQEESIRKQEQFYKEGRKLQEEQIKLSRQYWQEQHDLSVAAAGAAAAYAQSQVEIAQTMQEFENYTTSAKGELNLLNEDSLATLITELGTLDGTFKDLTETVKGLIKASGGTPSTSTGGSTGGRAGYPGRKQTGGHVNRGDVSWINEAEPELFRADVSGEVIPLSKYRSTWEKEIMAPEPPSVGASGPSTLQIYIGNRLIKEFILDTLNGEIEING